MEATSNREVEAAAAPQKVLAAGLGKGLLRGFIHGAGTRSPSLPPRRVPTMAIRRTTLLLPWDGKFRPWSPPVQKQQLKVISTSRSLFICFFSPGTHQVCGAWSWVRRSIRGLASPGGPFRTPFSCFPDDLPETGALGVCVSAPDNSSSPKELPLCVDVYDEVGIGGGASGVAGGLIHPYSPKGKLLWSGAEFWRECLKLLSIAERTGKARASDWVTADVVNTSGEQMVWRRGIIRPATTLKNAEMLKENARGCLDSCGIELLDMGAAKKLVPDLCVPFNSAIYMPRAVNIHPGRYLQALFLACKNLADDFSASGSGRREITLYKKSIGSLHELSGIYDGVIICLGAKACMLPELSGILPLRLCRGVVAYMKLPDDIREPYESWRPSVLSDAWFAVQGPRSAIMGSTWEWGSRDYSSRVSPEEGYRALEELLPKASTVYPAVKKWEFVGASGGVRAMPPLTTLGSLPLLGCVDDVVGGKVGCNYWLVGGLGARGLLYHGLLGKLIAQAVISHNEDILPSELTSWKKLNFTKEL